MSGWVNLKNITNRSKLSRNTCRVSLFLRSSKIEKVNNVFLKNMFRSGKAKKMTNSKFEIVIIKGGDAIQEHIEGFLGTSMF